MGMCLGKDVRGERTADMIINKQLRNNRRQQTNEVKLLLLGAGGSGKSTVFKQMSILHKNGFTDEDRKSYVTIVRSNIVLTLKRLIMAVEENDLSLPEDLEAAVRAIRDVPEGDFDNIKNEAIELWENETIKKAWAFRNCYHIEDSTKHLLNKLEKIAKDDYIPSDQDILYARAKTTGVIQTEFNVKKYNFKMVDVGGQRNERKKWIHCFQDVQGILYIASLTGFDELCVEDDRTNRMKESLQLFDETVNSRWFKNSSMILFLNKQDLLLEMTKAGKEPSSIFPSYEGGADYDKVLAFIQNLFESQCRSKSRKVYTHITCATDTDNINRVFSSVQSSLFDDRLEDAGLL